MTAGLPVCRLEESCGEAGRVMIGYSRNPYGGRRTSIIVVPAHLANGGIPGCLEHAHAAVDGLIMETLGPATPPDRECIPKADDAAGDGEGAAA